MSVGRQSKGLTSDEIESSTKNKKILTHTIPRRGLIQFTPSIFNRLLYLKLRTNFQWVYKVSNSAKAFHTRYPIHSSDICSPAARLH